jgi:hypothetical protein
LTAASGLRESRLATFLRICQQRSWHRLDGMLERGVRLPNARGIWPLKQVGDGYVLELSRGKRSPYGDGDGPALQLRPSDTHGVGQFGGDLDQRWCPERQLKRPGAHNPGELKACQMVGPNEAGDELDGQPFLRGSWPKLSRGRQDALHNLDLGDLFCGSWFGRLWSLRDFGGLGGLRLLHLRTCRGASALRFLNRR